MTTTKIESNNPSHPADTLKALSELKDPGPPVNDAGSGASYLWDLLYAVVVVIALPVFIFRRFIKKKQPGNRSEKWGNVLNREPHKKRIWIHAVSVGEALATWTLHKEIQKQMPDADVVISTTTSTGQAVAKQRWGNEPVFYFPVDFSSALKKAFDRTKPNLIVLMELEVWPNFTREASARGIPIIVVNGRLTFKSTKRYRSSRWLLGSSFRRVRNWLMQNQTYAERAALAGVDPSRINITGNLKYDSVETTLPTPEEKMEARKSLGLHQDDVVIFAGSTHPTEEKSLLNAYRSLQEKGVIKKLRLVLTPRHPERLKDIEKEITAADYPFVHRSVLKQKGMKALEHLPKDSRKSVIVLVDTMGELKQLYKSADVAFIGGSLIPHGGQNVMEPAGMAIPTVYGPNMHNFAEQVLLLRDVEGGIMVDDATELSGTFEKILTNPDDAKAMGQRAHDALLKKQGASEIAVAYMKKLLEEQNKEEG